MSGETSPSVIMDYIQSQPIKYKLQTKYGECDKLYPNGIDTALNNSRITHFYLKYFRHNKKPTTILPTPSLDTKLYDKLNNLIKLCDAYLNDEKSLQNRLLREKCFQMMQVLLYEDYFGVDFRYGNGHRIIQELILPENEDDLYALYNEWNDKNSEIRGMLFYADAIPVVSAIEKF